MSLHELPVVVGRATADTWYAIPLVDPVPPPPPIGLPIHTALGPTRDLALKHLQQRLIVAHDLGDRCLQPLRLDQPKLLRFRIDWPRTGASPLPIQIDVVQGFDRDSEEWAAAVPLLGLLVYAERAEELRAAVTFAVLNRVGTEQVARITPTDPPELAAVRVHFRDWPFGDEDAVPAVLAERSELLPITLPSDQRALGREEAAEDLARRLLQPPIRLVLVGPRGAGKTTLLRDAVARLRHVFDRSAGAHPPRVFRTNAARLIGGTRWLGEWQEQCEQVVSGIQETGGILAVDNLADLLGAGGDDPNASVGAFLVPWLARGELPFVTEATLEELDACSRLLPALADLLEPLSLPDLSTDALHALLAQVAAAGSPMQRLQIDPAVPATVADLFARFLPYTPNVQAAPFLRSVVAAVRQGDRQLSATVVRQHFAARTSLPAMMIDDTVPLHGAELQARLGARVIGQPAAVTTVVDLLLTLKAGLQDPARPLGVLLFCGPTGTGKTELARALGDLLFPHRPASDRLPRGGGAVLPPRVRQSDWRHRAVRTAAGSRHCPHRAEGTRGRERTRRPAAPRAAPPVQPAARRRSGAHRLRSRTRRAPPAAHDRSAGCWRALALADRPPRGARHHLAGRPRRWRRGRAMRGPATPLLTAQSTG